MAAPGLLGRLGVRARVMLVGVALCGVLAVAVVVGSSGPGPLDEADQADQRNGLLLSAPTLAPTVDGVPVGGSAEVLLFLRALPPDAVLAGWQSGLPSSARVTVVLQADSEEQLGEGTAARLVVDPQQQVARAVELPTPLDGGPGVGYAVVDPDGVVRYATLDPSWRENAFEVATIVGATS